MSESQDPIDQVLAIDVHGHYGRFARPKLPTLTQDFSSADAAEVARRARAERVEWTVVSPLKSLMPRGEADAAAGNAEAFDLVARTQGLLQYVVVNPLQPETYAQARDMLQSPKCVGIKIHPEEHCYEITEHGKAIFDFAESVGALVLTHSGESRSLPMDFIPFADACPGVRLILAHIGCGDNGERSLQVRAVQASRLGNVYADTSSAQSITPGLIEWAVKELGPEYVLFGTDVPLYSTALQRRRIDAANIDDRAKRMILRENAERLIDYPALKAAG